MLQACRGGIGNCSERQKYYLFKPAGYVPVIAEFNWGTDMDFATLNMREKIDLLKGFSGWCRQPDDFKFDPAMMPIIFWDFRRYGSGRDKGFFR